MREIREDKKKSGDWRKRERDRKIKLGSCFNFFGWLYIPRKVFAKANPLKSENEREKVKGMKIKGTAFNSS